MIRGTRAHRIGILLSRPDLLYDHIPMLSVLVARLSAGTYTKVDLDLLESYVSSVVKENEKLRAIDLKLRVLQSDE